jgi:hypothetical protein
VIDYAKHYVCGEEPDWIKEFKRCEPYIESALDYAHDTFNLQDIVDSMAVGDLQLWPGPNSAVITQIVNYPQKKVIHVFLAGGDMDEVKKLEEDLSIWGKHQGCKAVTLVGRPGWKKSFLKDIGYKCTQVQMFKEN